MQQSTHWVKIKESGATTGMRFMVFVHRLAGRTFFNILLFPVMVYFYLRRGAARKASMDFMQRVQRRFPEQYGRKSARRMSFSQFLAFGQSLLDKYLAWVNIPEVPDMDPASEKQFADLIESGKGCLIMGSHYGNIEHSRGVAKRRPDVVINVLMHDRHAQKFARLMAESGPHSRMNLIQVTDLDAALALSLKEKVERGEWVVIAADRVPVGEGSRVCTAPFLGEPAPFPIGPYVLAALLKCPVYLLHCYLQNDRYCMEIDLFEQEFKLPRTDRQEFFEESARRYASSLERQVKRDPKQWFNFFDFWRQ